MRLRFLLSSAAAALLLTGCPLNLLCDVCTLGESRCSGGGVETCIADGESCTAWSAPTACSSSTCNESTGTCGSSGGGSCGGVPVAGRCVSSTRAEYCEVATGSAEPRVRSVDCPGGQTCRIESGRARCRASGACFEGETRCRDSSTLEGCQAGAWATQACPNGCNGDNPLGAFCLPDVATHAVRMTFRYEAKGPNPDRTDWGASELRPAAGFLVASFSKATGKLEGLDVGVTAADGSVTIHIPDSPTPGDILGLLAVGMNKDGSFRFMVANPGFNTSGAQEVGVYGSDPAVWVWAWNSSSITDGATATISQAEGSGAAHIFRYLQSSFAHADAAFPGKTGLTLVAWAGLGTTWSCGACFAAFPVNAFDQSFDGQVWFPADLTDEAYWSDPVLAHELGHWVMASFATSPTEGGTHIMSIPTFPGQAWSEGWATWYSSDQRNSPLYYDKQQGSFFWLDLSSRQYSSAEATWTRPEANQGLLQRLDENEVSAMLWSLSRSSAGASASMYRALSSTQMNASPWSRGYTRHTWEVSSTGELINVEDTGESAPHLADFLDALECGGFSQAAVSDAVDPGTAYPYPASTPICR
ncbi:MAG TPA: hypothetical protein VGK67_05015 [Myxococcales bacterium]|jgi:hypothetical protein